MDSTEITTYQIIDVDVGDETVPCRPTKWDREIEDGEGRDKNGEHAIPTEYETTCPNCGQLIVIVANLQAAKCSECEVGTDVLLHDLFDDPFVESEMYVGPSKKVEKVEAETVAAEAENLKSKEWSEVAGDLGLDDDDEPEAVSDEVEDE
jgi:hypothetical protein